MAQQFIQPDALSEVQGSAGRVQTQDIGRERLTRNGINSVVKGIGDTLDTAGTVYADNKAKSLVNETIEEVDSAIAAAEKGADIDDMPDDVKLAQKEWTMVSNAVANGEMSREKARLIASSRLRTRIAEQPLFARKLREAASGVLGFNIESESARQYFASLPSQSSLAEGSQNSYQAKLWDQARAEASAMEGVSAQDVYVQLVQADQVARRKQIIEDEKALGVIDDEEAFTRFNQENSKIAFAGVMGEAAKEFKATGSVDEQVWGQVIEGQKQLELNALTDMWEGDQTSPAFQRAQQVIEDRYAGYTDFVETIGFDTLTELGIKRVENARQVLGNEIFGDIKLIAENLGSEIASQALDLFTNVTDPSRLAVQLKQNPQLGRAGVILGNPTAVKMFGDTVKKVYENMAEKKEPDPSNVDTETGISEEETSDWVMSQNWNKGGESEKTTLEYLVETGKEIKPLSLAVSKAPTRSEPETRDFFKQKYKNDLPRVVDAFSSVVADNPDLEWTLQDDGSIEIVMPSPDPTVTGGAALREDIRRTQRAMATFDEARIASNHINLFSEGIRKGWGTVANTTQSEHINELRQGIEQSFIRHSKRVEIDAQALVLEGALDLAEERFSTMKRLNPNYREFTFEEFAQISRELAGVE